MSRSPARSWGSGCGPALLSQTETTMLERGTNAWVLNGRPLRGGEHVELRTAGHADLDGSGWIPGVIVRDGLAVELEGTSDAIPGNRAADPRLTLTLEHVARRGIALRRAEWAH